MKGFDTPYVTTGLESSLVDAGYGALGLYLRPERSTKAMVDGLHAVGLQVWSVFEKGNPTQDSYFSAQQGLVDGHLAVSHAMILGQPGGSQIYAAVDYDADITAILGPITDYMETFQAVVKSAGFLASIYGSGLACQNLIGQGLSHTGWLAQSKGFSGYGQFVWQASIIQELQVQVGHLLGDPNDIPDAVVAGLW